MPLIPIVVVVIVLALGALFGLGWNASGHAIHPSGAAYDWTLADYPSLHAEEVVVESSTGARLAGRRFAGTTDTTIVLLHGYGGTQDELLPLADRLHAAGHTVFTYDQRGCGQSTGEVTFGAREQDDLRSVIDYLARRPGADDMRFAVFGFSMGGATALMTAPDDPRIEAVVADSAWSEVDHWLHPSVRAVFTRPRDRFNALSLKLAELRAGIDLDELRPVDAIGRLSPRPVLLVHAGADAVILPEESKVNYAAAGEPKELFIVPGAAHGDTVAPKASATYERVLDFFARTLAPTKKAAA